MAGLDHGEVDPAEAEPDGSTVSVMRVSAENGVITLRVTGQLDVETGPELDRHLTEATADAASRIVLDFGGVDFMDSSGIAVLLTAASRAAGLELTNPTRAVRRVITIAGLADVLPMSPDA